MALIFVAGIVFGLVIVVLAVSSISPSSHRKLRRAMRRSQRKGLMK